MSALAIGPSNRQPTPHAARTDATRWINTIVCSVVTRGEKRVLLCLLVSRGGGAAESGEALLSVLCSHAHPLPVSFA